MIHEGDRVMVFDSLHWGGKDVGDNRQFWKPATIARVYWRDGDVLADVRFDGGRESRGQFVSAMKPLGTRVHV